MKKMTQQPYIDFEIVLKNGSKCSVRYQPNYLGENEIGTGNGERFYHRVDHFEFTGNWWVSETLYRSHFMQLDNSEEIDYKKIALQIANGLANFEKEENTQLALI